MSVRPKRHWVLNAAFGVVAATLVALAVTPVPAQPAFAQTVVPPPVCEVPPCAMVPMVPGTELTSLGSGVVARVPTSNTVIGFQTTSNGPIQIDIRDVAAPVTIQIETTPGGLTAVDADGNTLAVTEISPGLYQVSQPS